MGSNRQERAQYPLPHLCGGYRAALPCPDDRRCRRRDDRILDAGPGPTASAATGGYVALGDSYSSGVGSTSDYLDDNCDTSAYAYPYLYNQSANPSSFSFEACSGATAPDIESSQLSALNSGTGLVSLTDGGDDVGFSTVMEDCVLYSQSTARARSTPPCSRPRPPCRAPSTRCTATSPTTPPTPRSWSWATRSCTTCRSPATAPACPPSPAPRSTTRADTLDSVISAQVAKYSGFTFADVRPYFSGHEICDSDSYLNSVTWPISSSYHPTAEGQAAYLQAFQAAL
ncbi:lipase [Streptacidiphilus sp. 4-A2]|nr:lipase [Streptacidiphilus sp. 4-A2]